ncbi:MAG: protein-L-isoaspartate(D-aspartate) O-methyltransferase [Burkholderiales bacterium]|nr:protein-L-isoaspartate(D-aspartate) O-methyltransferase [Burkholderiales bacterium]
MSVVPDHEGAEARVAFLMALRAQGLRDTDVLRAFETVPRSRFVPRRFVDVALTDIALPIACGQTTLAPSHMAMMIIALDVRPDHRVLEIGTGSGYGTAILARLGAEVVSVERYRSLQVEAATRLEALGVRNARVIHGDGRMGHPAGAPFDRILIDASVESIPAAVASQLASTGRIVAVAQTPDGPMLTRFARATTHDLSSEALRPLASPPLMAGVAAAL